MTTIRTTCPKCGEVDMGPTAIELYVSRGGREGTYRFTCPTCMDDVEKRADRKIVALLVSAGVDVAGRGGGGGPIEAAPDELPFEELRAPDDARGAYPSAPTFTIDDIIDFHFRLQDDRYIEDFLAHGPR